MKKFFVVAIEPEKNNFNLIKKMGKIFKLENSILPVNFAVSDKDCYTTLYSWSNLFMFSTISSEWKEELMNSKKWKEELIRSCTFNTLVKELHLDPSEIKIVKIDAEGAEDLIISGMKKSFVKNIPLIIFECFSFKKLGKIKKKIEQLNFKIKWKCDHEFVCLNKNFIQK